MKRFVAACALLVFAPNAAHAWGGQGHRLIASLAYARLTPAARAGVDALVAAGPEHRIEGCALASFADASTWPDCVRRTAPFTATYNEHFDDIPLFGRSSKRLYCPGGACASEAIRRNRAIVADHSAQPGARLEALAFLVHYISDLHQPLHAADNADRGGNDVKVNYLGVASYTSPYSGEPVRNTLHGIWDTPLVSAALGPDGRGQDQIAALADAHRRSWGAFAPDRWAQDSHALAVRFAYGRLPVAMRPSQPPAAPVEIDQAYVNAATPIVRDQLARAVVRVAATLNATLR